MAALYAVSHGPSGLRVIAHRVHRLALVHEVDQPGQFLPAGEPGFAVIVHLVAGMTLVQVRRDGIRVIDAGAPYRGAAE